MIFEDAKDLFYSELQAAKAETELEKFDLSSVLQLLIGTQKLEHSYVEMNLRLRDSTSDISDIIAYCMFDAYSLILVDQKYKIIESKLSLG